MKKFILRIMFLLIMLGTANTIFAWEADVSINTPCRLTELEIKLNPNGDTWWLHKTGEHSNNPYIHYAELVHTFTYYSDEPEPETNSVFISEFDVEDQFDDALVQVFGYFWINGWTEWASANTGNIDPNNPSTTIQVLSMYENFPPDDQIYTINIDNDLGVEFDADLYIADELIFVEQAIVPGNNEFNDYEFFANENANLEGEHNGIYGESYSITGNGITDAEYDDQDDAIYFTLDINNLDSEELPTSRYTNLFSGWNWVSFPVLHPDFNDPMNDILEPVIDNGLIQVQFKDDFIWLSTSGWQNDIGDFSSIDGYKIEMSANRNLEVAGWWEDTNTPIPLEPNPGQHYSGSNWVGFFLPYSISFEDAFSGIWDNLVSVIAEDWFYFKPVKEPPPTIPPVDFTLNPGNLYIIDVDDNYTLYWEEAEQKEPYEKPETEFFSYDEKADYQPILIDTVYGAQPQEIGIFAGDECVGASVVEEYPVQLMAYIDDDSTRYRGDELTFQLYNHGRNKSHKIQGIQVYDSDLSEFIEKPLYPDMDNFATVRLFADDSNTISKEFILNQNYPNPMKNSTSISFSLTKDSQNCKIEIYNTKGQLVKKLRVTDIENGNGSVVWNGKDDNENEVSAGIYFYKMISDKKTDVKKLLKIN